MEEKRVEQQRPKGKWRAYSVIIVLGLLFIVLPMVAVIYFQEEIRQAQTYGYAGVFLVGLLCGISVIPAPALWLIFTFGAVLNPWFVGLVAGLGGAVGGITVYLTGAGMETIWSRLREKQRAFEHRLELDKGAPGLPHSRFWSKVRTSYQHLADWVNGGGGSWALFVTSAMVVSPFYPAGLAAGSLRMGLLRFFLICWAGKTVRFLTISFAGYFGLNFLLRCLGGA